MVRRILFIVVCSIFCNSIPVRALAAQGWTGNVNLTLGGVYRSDLGSEFEQIDATSLEAGLSVDCRARSWPVNIYFGIKASEANADIRFLAGPIGLIGSDWDEEIKFTEVQLGVRKIWEESRRVRPYVGCGLAYAKAEYSLRDRDYDWGTNTWQLALERESSSSGIGAWLNAGIYWTLFSHMNIGMDIGYSYIPLALDVVDYHSEEELERDINAGGFRIAVALGLHL